MRRQGFFFLILLVGLAAGCSARNSAGGDIRLAQPFILSDQQWHITRKAETPDGGRVCTLSSGELAVTLRGHGGRGERQVETRNPLNPGDRYKVLIGGQMYETVQNWFGPRQSGEIIQNLLKNPVAYTEKRELTVRLGHAGPDWRSIDNKIPAGEAFALPYRECEHYTGWR